MHGTHVFWRVLSLPALGLSLCLSLAPATPAQAGGEVTTCTENGLDAATGGGGLITFNCGGHHAPAIISFISPFTIGGTLIIDGSKGGNTVTLDGVGSTRLFSVTNGASLTLANLTLANGFTTEDGGCLYTNGALQLNNVQLMLCQADSGSRGGGLFVSNTGSAALVNSSVHDNSADYAGGGVYSWGALTVTNSYVARNIASASDGGGIWAIGTTVIAGSTFYSNTALNGHGGGVYIQGALRGCEFIEFSRDFSAPQPEKARKFDVGAR